VFLQTDVTGLSVLVAGPPGSTDGVRRRYMSAGALVTVASSAEAMRAKGGAHFPLTVCVGRGPDWDAAVEAARERGLVAREDPPGGPRGRIVLVGAGPGGPGLLTLDALRALRDADVVLTDRLAAVGDLRDLAPGAEVIDVGKRPGHHAVPQREIEALIVAHASHGRTVVRLKGGDPFVFGRGGEEVAAAVAAGLSVSVVPGITSAVSVPGAAGIPVTHRGVSHVFTVVSGHVPIEPDQARCLSGLGGTIVLLMGMHALPQHVAALRRGGLDPETPAAIVERGFAPDQQSLVATLGDLPAVASRHGATSPAVIVIGDVVRQSAVWAGRRAGPVVGRAS
jgi:uroporphyrin-III C-methyltransferase